MFRSLDSDISVGVCPYCDAKESFKFKENEAWMFLCHDCQRYMPFEKTGIKNVSLHSVTTNSFINYNSVLSLCTLVRDLPSTHPFRKYCVYRRIPFTEREVYYTDRFDEISKFADTPVNDKERLILPFYNAEGKLFGVQGRSLEKDQIRYITLMFNKDEDKVFGMEQVDTTKPFFVTEGPIDSLFVKNCAAMAGSSVSLNKYISNAILAYDNEPRSKEIVSKMKKSLEDGYSIVIWPDTIKEKDVNDMVMSDRNPQLIMEQNIYSGLAGIIKLNEWKK